MRKMNIDEYTKLQRVKYMIFSGKEEIENIIYENADYFEESVFSIEHLELLKEMILNNSNMFNKKIKNNTIEVLEFFKENMLFYDKISKKKYELMCNQIIYELNKINNNNSLFYLKEFSIRTRDFYDKIHAMLVNNGELKKVVDESIKLDHCIVDILNPDININLNDKLYNCTWCLFSINKFIEEQPELFNNKIVEKRIKYIALKQMSNNINSDIVSKTQIEDNVKYILERIK